MAKLTPEQFQDKHARRLKASEPDIRLGIERVSVAPGVSAGKKADKMRANILKSIDDGTWKKRVEAVGLDVWKRKAIDVGVGRIASGIDAAKDKVINFAGQLLPAFHNSMLNRLPDGRYLTPSTPLQQSALS